MAAYMGFLYLIFVQPLCRMQQLNNSWEVWAVTQKCVKPPNHAALSTCAEEGLVHCFTSIVVLGVVVFRRGGLGPGQNAPKQNHLN